MQDLKAEVQTYLETHIPLGRFMQIQVVRCDEERAVLSAPLAPNINDKGIAFGGSLSVLATLAAWAKFFEYTKRKGLEGELLISHAETRFLQPGRGQLIAICDSPSDEDWERFELFLQRKGRGRITFNSRVESEDIVALEMTAQFAAVKNFGRS